MSPKPRMPLRRKLAILVLALVSVGIIVLLSLPPTIRWYIEKNYPGVTVVSMCVRPTHIKLSLTVERPNLWAVLGNVRVDWNKSIKVTGGSVRLTLNGKKPIEEHSGHKLSATGLHIDVISERWNAELNDVAIQENQDITVSSGHVRGKTFEVSVTEARRFGLVVLVKSAQGTLKKPVGPFESLTGEAKNIRALPTWDSNVNPSVWRASAEQASVTLEGYPKVELNEVSVNEILDAVLAKSVRVGESHAENVAVTRFEKLNMYTVSMDSATVQHKWLSPTPVAFDKPTEIVFLTEGVLTAYTSAFTAHNRDMKPVSRFREEPLSGLTWFTKSKTVDGVASCSAWVDSFPIELRKPLEGITFTGDVNFRVKYGESPDITIHGGCTAKCDATQLKALQGDFHYKVYSSRNELVDRVAGPSTPEWVPSVALPTGLLDAVVTMEDPGFAHHRGFIAEAYKNSLVDNLKLGKFLRGGSTISMQLAKNLWLTRDKTLGRKAQEFFLAQALESCLTKEQILELYLNVVEFGPDIYGIGPAAQHYFKTSAARLKPVEAFWLASILPRPRSAKIPDEAALERVKKLMGRFASTGKISETYLEDAAPQDDSEWGL